MALGVDSLMIFDGFLEPKWNQVGIKMKFNFEKRFNENTLFFYRKNNDFEGSGAQSWK